MPQLNPEPWFSTACLVWVTFLVVLMPKFVDLVLPSSPLAGPSAPGTSHNHPSNLTYWNWPWSQASSTNS
uniref:ATP synthase complex subunit 8 n=1 Tax=Limnichthys fasciatus TaxID=270600 RepID=A0A1V1FHJ6_9TELE|nr:ATPase subunit 8 [Limnichthys fasciatus]BBU26064.1 ATPase subunit 8 [Limnichthys fasciatus]